MSIIENVGRPLVGLLTGIEDFFYDSAQETHKGPPYIFKLIGQVINFARKLFIIQTYISKM
jgi:hypothetical protein